MHLSIKYLKIVISLIFLSIFIQSNAQEIKPPIENYNTTETYSIKWFSQFPSTKKQKKSKRKNWLSTFLFGKRNIATITKPTTIIATDSSTFLVLDQGSRTIFNVENNQLKIPKVLKKNKQSFPSLVGFCKLPTNDILFTDSRLNKIYRMNEKQKILQIFNDSLLLKQPTGIAYSTVSNQIWVIETTAHKISILNEQGAVIKTIGKKGMLPGEFNYPTNLWIDSKGYAYVVDALNFRIQIFDKNGTFVSAFGELGDATGYFARPKGIATDSLGNIYISDALFHTVQVFDISGNYLYQFGKQGRGEGEFWMPSGIYIDNNDFIYVADSYNSRIQIFQLIKE